MTNNDDTAINWFSGKRVLVTGGGGFIAAALIEQLCRTDCHVIRLLRHQVDELSPSKAIVEDLVGDVRDPLLWQSLPIATDVIFHLAAQTSTYEANRDPRADLDSNVLPMLLMLQACKERSISPIVIYASTVTVSGLPDRLPVDETYPDAPVTVYDLHKQMAESYLKYFVQVGVVRGVILRLANVYGPGPKSSSSDRGILNQMVRRALRGEALTVYGKGEQLRDYVHVEDVARAFIAAAANVDVINGRHCVIGRGQGYSISQALQLVAQLVAVRTGTVVPVVNVEPPAGLSPIEARNFVANTNCFSSATGWNARYSLEQGINTIIEGLA